MANKKSYSDKLKDPRWQKVRLRIMERDNFQCKVCGDTKTTLAVHHCEYMGKNEPWEYPEGLLITLCEDCHKDEHSGIRDDEIKDYVAGLKGCGILLADISHLFEAISEYYSSREELSDLTNYIHSTKEDKICYDLESIRSYIGEIKKEKQKKYDNVEF